VTSTWSLVEVTGRRDIHNVAVTAGPPRTIFIVANREIYASTDNGASWEPRNMQQCLPWEYPRKENYLRGIAVDPGNSKRIFLSFGDFTPGSSGAIAQSEDFCKSWKFCRYRWNRTRRCGRSLNRRPNYFRREPIWLSLPQRRRRRVVDEAEKRAERDRGRVLAAELTRVCRASFRKTESRFLLAARCSVGSSSRPATGQRVKFKER
jgi:hypothetical protein